MSIIGLNSSFQFPDTSLQYIQPSISLMFADWNNTKIFQPIIRFNPVKMMNKMSLGNLAMNIHPNLDMFTDITITTCSRVIRKIKHYITIRLKIATTFPAWMILACSQFKRTFNATDRDWTFRFTTIRAYMISSIRFPSTFTASFIMLMNKFITKGTLFCTSIIIGITYQFVLAIRTQLLMFCIRNKCFLTSSTWFSIPFSRHWFSPIKGFTNIIALSTKIASKKGVEQ